MHSAFLNKPGAHPHRNVQAANRAIAHLMGVADKNGKVLISLRNLFLALVTICYVLQLVIEPSAKNTGVATICFLSGIALLFLHFKPLKLREYPISGMMVAMPILTSLLLPIVFTTLEWKPVVFNLNEPVTTFTVSAICAAALVFAHFVYRSSDSIRNAQSAIQGGVLKSLGVFTPLAPLQFWALGLIGMVALVYIYVIRSDSNMDRTGTVVKLVEGLMPFAYAPFALLMPGLYEGRRSSGFMTKILVGCYFLMLLVFAMASNYRYAFAIALMMPVLCYVVGLISGLTSARHIRLPIVILGIVAGALGYVVFTDLALAMQIARSNRGQVKGVEMIKITWDTLSDRGGLDAIKENIYSAETSELGYTEYYVANPLIARFIYTKYDDNGHYYRKQMTSLEADQFRDFMRDRFWSQLPTPLLRFLPFQVDKLGVASMSYGDWFVMMTTKVEHAAFRTGSYQAGAFLAFGYFFPIVIFFCALGVFFVIDLLALRYRVSNMQSGVVAIAPVGLIYMHALVFFTARESLTDWAGFIIRFFPQMIIVYLILGFITKPFNMREEKV